MTRLNAKQSRLGKDAVVVTPGLIPCGCVIDSVALDSKELRLTLKQFTSPAVLDQLSSSAAGQADLHVFLDHDHHKQHIHFRGAVGAGRGNSISLDIAGITPELKREVELLVQHTGRSRLAEAAPDPALKQLYHQHCRR